MLQSWYNSLGPVLTRRTLSTPLLTRRQPISFFPSKMAAELSHPLVVGEPALPALESTHKLTWRAFPQTAGSGEPRVSRRPPSFPFHRWRLSTCLADL